MKIREIIDILSSAGSRPIWTTVQVRPLDLNDGDRILVKGKWREILDLYKTLDDFNAVGWGDERQAAVRKYLDTDPEEHVVARYLIEEESLDGEITDELAVFRRAELVTIQFSTGSIKNGRLHTGRLPHH